MSSLPLALTHRFSDEDALPTNFKNEIEKHFTLLPFDVYVKNTAKFDKDIVAIFPWFAQPEVTSEMLDRMPSLKVVATISVGYNHLDIPMIRSKNIRVGNTPGVLDDATAEQAITLMLAAARNTVKGVEIAMGEKAPGPIMNYLGKQFSDSTLGIVGMGRIGKAIARRAHGFGCEILYHNRSQRNDDAEFNAKYFASMDEMLPHCDFVCVVCALTDETQGLIKYKQFELMKRSAIFCNISRGGTVEQGDLVKALNERLIHMAALDVTTPEPLPRDDPLLKCDNCIIVPHWGSATEQTRMKMVRLAIQNALAAIRNDKTLPAEVF